MSLTYLESLKDYVGAPDGTIVVGRIPNGVYSRRWRKSHGKWWSSVGACTSETMAGTRREWRGWEGDA